MKGNKEKAKGEKHFDAFCFWSVKTHIDLGGIEKNTHRETQCKKR